MNYFFGHVARIHNFIKAPCSARYLSTLSNQSFEMLKTSYVLTQHLSTWWMLSMACEGIEQFKSSDIENVWYSSHF